jgi:serine protease Do
MDDSNKKNSFDDSFQNRGPEDEVAKKEEQETESSDKQSYYYSYGPFKSSNGESGKETSTGPSSDRNETAVSSENVEITPPKAVPAYTQTALSKPQKGEWQFKKESRRSSFRSLFSAFLAGVILIGGLMYMSDRQNWFSSDQALAAQASASGEATQAKESGSGNAVSTVLDTVRPNNIAQIFEQSSPAVVKIETYVSGNSQGGGNSNDPFWQFFGDGSFSQPDDGGNSGSDQLVPNGLGSGFLFEKDGYILTNQHVVGDSAKVTVTVQGHDKPFEAKVLGQSYDLDLAVLKIEGSNFPTLPLGDSNGINIGEWVVAIGNPNGFDHTVTVGVLSAKERPIQIPDTQGTRNYEHLLQTDASINPGNSGGPLLNLAGEVIGINTAVSAQSQGIGFAIPSSTIKEVVDNLKQNKEIPKTPSPFIGATLQDITDQIAKELGLSSTDGSIVYNILYNSPAYKSDLRQYDVITGMDGTTYKNKEDLIAVIQKKKVGDKVTLNVLRGGKKIDLQVQIGNKNDFNAQQ